jgi:hypothetical protein
MEVLNEKTQAEKEVPQPLGRAGAFVYAKTHYAVSVSI